LRRPEHQIRQSLSGRQVVEKRWSGKGAGFYS
jgi:hypothetical protein